VLGSAMLRETSWNRSNSSWGMSQFKRPNDIFPAPPESSEFLRIDVLEDASNAPNVLRSLNLSQLAPRLVV
jgi:hypothetical protein